MSLAGLLGKRHDGSAMTAQHWYWAAGGVALLLIVVAGIAEHRRNHRRDLDATGWAPWRGIQMAAFFALIVVLIFAFHR
jgi:phosphoglycerol transferase MdoB-like AlkP superfamily enzyme